MRRIYFHLLQIPELRDSESETVLYTLIAESDDLSSSQLPDKIRSAVKDSSLPFYIKVRIDSAYLLTRICLFLSMVIPFRHTCRL